MDYVVEDVLMRVFNDETKDYEPVKLKTLLSMAGYDQTAAIPDGVQAIDSCAVTRDKCPNLKGIDLPGSVIHMAEAPFSDRPEFIEVLQFGEGACIMNIDSLSKVHPELRLRLEDGSYIVVPRQPFITYFWKDEPRLPITLESISDNFSRIKKREDKVLLAKSICENKYLKAAYKKKFAKFLGLELPDEPCQMGEYEIMLVNIAVRGTKEDVAALAEAFGGDARYSGKGIVTAYIGNVDKTFTRYEDLPLHAYPQVKAVLFIEETGKENGDCVAAYKKSGQDFLVDYSSFTDKETFHREEVAESFPAPFLDKDFRHTYLDLSCGEERTIEYKFGFSKDWSDKGK